MSSIRSYGRRVGSLFAVAALVLATITPGLIPSFASAAQITERSVTLSSSSRSNPNTTYNLEFTAVNAAGSLVLAFCGNSPLIEAECTAPAGLVLTGAASADATDVTVDGNALVIEDTIATGANQIAITGITNPSAIGPMYLRIITYTGTTADAQYTDAENIGTHLDTAGAAVNITDTIGVQGAVLESMTFCVAGPTDNAGTLEPTIIGDNCTNGNAGAQPSDPLPAPALKLGEKVGDIVALDSNFISEGSIYSQISTNASSGAIVNLKSGAAGCGGLIRAGSGTCDILPTQSADVAAGTASFGAKLSLGAADADGELGVEGIYNALTFALAYDNTLATGVTSTYGDPFFNTNGAPASNKNLEVIFGASVAPNTPAGLYSADLSLIATGKF